MPKETYSLTLPIVVAPFGVQSYRAATRLGGKTFVSPGAQEPAAAVQLLLSLLCAHSGQNSGEPMLAIEMELMGSDAGLLKLLNDAEATKK